MSATASFPSATLDASPANPHDVLQEIASGVNANGDALSLNLDLLKRIIELLLPKATGDGPTLAELLAAVLAAMRELLLVERANAAGIDDILHRLDVAGISAPASRPRATGNNGP